MDIFFLLIIYLELIKRFLLSSHYRASLLPGIRLFAYTILSCDPANGRRVVWRVRKVRTKERFDSALHLSSMASCYPETALRSTAVTQPASPHFSSLVTI